jgi:hypothetical protein
LQDLEQKITDLESSSDQCLQRSSRLMITLAQMANSYFSTVELQNDNDALPGQVDELEQMNHHSNELCDQHNEYRSESDNIIQHEKPTKLQQMLASSTKFSSSFVSEVLKKEANEQDRAITHATSPETQSDLKDRTKAPSSYLLEELHHVIDNAPILASEENHVRKLKQISCTFPPPSTRESPTNVPDGPSQRAATLLMSRLSVTMSQLPQHEVRQMVKTQHWNGSELCIDRYAFAFVFVMY